MKIALTLILLFATHYCSVDVARPQSSDLVGRWKVDITFENQSKRSLRFDADDSGTGSLLLEDHGPTGTNPPSHLKQNGRKAQKSA